MENLNRQNKKLTQSLLIRGLDSNNFVRVQDLLGVVNNIEELITTIPVYSEYLPVEIVNTNYVVLITDRIIKANTSNILITLPTAINNDGKQFTINNASDGDITVDVVLSQTINQELIQTIPSNSSMQVYSDGSNYWII